MGIVYRHSIRIATLAALLLTMMLSLDGMAARKREVASSYAWQTVGPLGFRQLVDMDTSIYNYSMRSVPSAVSPAWACTGNLGGEGINMIYADRLPMSQFFFRDALRAWMPQEDSHTFYNTRIPMTLLSYNTGGTRYNEQNRLKGLLTGNASKELQIGANLDYLYSKGSYDYQATNDFTWGLMASYIGEKWEMQAYYNHWNLLNKESGGITDDLYITDPAELQGGDDRIDAKSIPTNLTAAHSRVMGSDFWMSNRYKVGFWRDEQLDDTTFVERFVPVSSFIWTFRYQNDKHLFIDTNSTENTTFWDNAYISLDDTWDTTSHWELTNTVGIDMLEGFNKWVPFGLAVYGRHQVRRYTQTVDTIAHSGSDRPEGLTPWPKRVSINPVETQNLVWVGGQITRQQTPLLRLSANAELGLIGPAAGEVKINGNLSTRFKLLRDSVMLGAYFNFHNVAAPYLMNNYVSNHFVWQNDFGKTRTVKIGGNLNIGRTATTLNASVENVQNLIYFGEDGLPVQDGGNVQVVTLQLTQNLHAGILNWDNRITYQTSTNDQVLPLPKLAVYSNLYLLFKVAGVMQVQFGVDCDYYTRYYAPNYQPATMSFCNQRSIMVGNYPFMNAYANFKLDRARFYVMYSHVNQGMTGMDYFSLPHYPLNPRRFQLGVIVDFLN